MIKISQAIVVEGKYDKITLSQIVDANIFETSGFRIMKDKAMQQMLRRIAKERGLIVFTDSDGAGFVIRNFLKQIIPPDHLLHAYIPDVYGKERRKSAPGKEGKIGLEGMHADVIINALKNCGATAETGDRKAITKQDMYLLGLSGRADSAAARRRLMRKLGLPEHLSANGLLQALNALYTPDELMTLLLVGPGLGEEL